MKKILTAISVLVLVLLVSGFCILNNQAGLNVLLALIDKGELSVSAEVRSGSLMSGFELENVKLSIDAGDVSINHFRLEWDLLDFLFTEKRIQLLLLEDVIYLANIEEQPPEQPPLELNIPNLLFDSFIITNLQVQNADESGSFQLEHLQASFQVVNNVISLSDFMARMQNLELNSNGSFLLQLPYTVNLSTDGTYTTGSGRQIIGNVSIGGELNQIQTTIDIPHGNATISVADISTSPVWTANLSLSEFRPDEIDITLPEVGVNLDLNMQGTATTATGNSMINLDYSSLTVAEGGVAGDQGSIIIPDEFQLGFDTRLDTDNQLITINEISISTGDIRINSSGVFNFLEKQFNIAINWSDWLINISEDLPPVAASGRMTLDGELDSYNISSSVSITGSGPIPSTSLSINGEGDLDGLRIEPLDLQLLDGAISATVGVNWADSIEAGITWEGEALNPAVIWIEWPGRLNTSGNLRLTQMNETWSWVADGIDISGFLKDAPLTVNLVGNSQIAGEINLSARADYANLDMIFDGTISDELDINWEINTPDLSRVDESLAGEVSSIGNVTGTLDFPEINAQISANNVDSPWGSSRQVAVSMNTGVDIASDINAAIFLEGMTVDETELESLQADLTGTRAAHSFSVAAKLPDLDLNVSGLGNYIDSNWRGEIQVIELAHERFETWTLADTTALAISNSRYASGPLCMRHPSGSICLEGMYEPETGYWSIDAKSSRIPLSLLQSELPGAPEIDGRADVFLQLNGNNSRPETGIVRLDIPDGQISMAHSDNSQHIIPLEGTFLEVKLEAATLTGVATVPALNENFKPVLVNVEMTGYEDLSALPLDLPIKGKLVAGGDDLSLLSLITPELESLLGSFDIDINIAGTLHEPQFQGKAEITNASYQFLDLGIAIDDINLVGTNMPDFGYEINGQLRSGDGIIQAEASVQQITREGIELTAELSGENFEMVNLPELWAIVNPTIQSRLSVGNQYYQGDIMIPAALIDLDEAVNTAAISDDEIVDGKKLNDQTEVVNQHISVNVSLGDEVEIRGMGITGKLSGQLFLSNINTNNILVADGEIAIIDGKFAAYGQELTISEGRLIYNKVSIENPTLSVKAIRNVDDITVGVSVSGYLSSPTVTLFSSSSLPQEEILSYIVFGRPLNSLTSGEGQDLIGAATALGISKSGLLTEKIASTFGLDQFSLSGSTAQDASIVVGKYINPRLYLSYGLGIVDRISTARLNYKLSNSFSLEAERGQEAGVDVFYNIEK